METRKYATNVVSAVSGKFLSQFGSHRIRSHCHWHRGGAFEFESILNCKCLAFEPWQSWSNRQRLFLKQVVFTEEFHWNLILPKIFFLSKIKYEKEGEILVKIFTKPLSQRPGQDCHEERFGKIVKRAFQERLQWENPLKKTQTRRRLAGGHKIVNFWRWGGAVQGAPASPAAATGLWPTLSSS